MSLRPQRTIARPVDVSGIGFLTGADIHLRFCPARPEHGIAFVRTDMFYAPPIPALVEYTVPRQRRTAIQRCGVAVEMIEHVMAALAGLQIDNCLVQLSGPEPPGCDGSSLLFAQRLCDAGIVEQDALRPCLEIEQGVCVRGGDGSQAVQGAASVDESTSYSYKLDYGPGSPIAAQNYAVRLTPETFLNEIAFARTFLLEQEAQTLKAQGYGRRTTPRDLLIFSATGPIDNELRAPDECARHKILDCIGDLALCGCDLRGVIAASRSGHQLNAEFVRRIKRTHAEPARPAESGQAA